MVNSRTSYLFSQNISINNFNHFFIRARQVCTSFLNYPLLSSYSIISFSVLDESILNSFVIFTKLVQFKISQQSRKRKKRKYTTDLGFLTSTQFNCLIWFNNCSTNCFKHFNFFTWYICTWAFK